MADNAALLEAGPRGPRTGGKRRGGAGEWSERLAALFPQAAGPGAGGAPGRRPGRRWVGVAIQAAVVCAAAGLLLLRVAGIPAWDGTYAEDNGVFLVDGLVRPWHLFVPYSGYLELGPRIIGQLIASFLPIVDASAAYAITGALIAAATGLFLYHASEGYLSARWARILLGAALVLLPIAPLDIVDSGVDSPWYAMAGLFFAVLWRPRSWPGMLAAALVACYASSSEIVAFIYAPLLLARVIALPRVREHAVTAGWLFGLVLQVPVVMLSYEEHKQRLGALATPGQALAFYCHNVVLRALGWHLSVWLKSVAGYNGATVIVGAVLALALGWALVTGDRAVRLFAAIALLTGFVQTVFDATISPYVLFQQPTPAFMAAARYSTIPILLIAATGIVAVDSCVRRHGPLRRHGVRQHRAFWRDGAFSRYGLFRWHWAFPRHWAFRRHGAFRRYRARPLVAVCVLACLLGFGWITDFRYASQRVNAGRWLPYAQSLVTACDTAPAGGVSLNAWGGHHFTVPCARIHR